MRPGRGDFPCVGPVAAAVMEAPIEPPLEEYLDKRMVTRLTLLHCRCLGTRPPARTRCEARRWISGHLSGGLSGGLGCHRHWRGGERNRGAGSGWRKRKQGDLQELRALYHSDLAVAEAGDEVPPARW